jgi:hypothetical protein
MPTNQELNPVQQATLALIKGGSRDVFATFLESQPDPDRALATALTWACSPEGQRIIAASENQTIA